MACRTWKVAKAELTQQKNERKFRVCLFFFHFILHQTLVCLAVIHTRWTLRKASDRALFGVFFFWRGTMDGQNILFHLLCPYAKESWCRRTFTSRSRGMPSVFGGPEQKCQCSGLSRASCVAAEGLNRSYQCAWFAVPRVSHSLTRGRGRSTAALVVVVWRYGL